MFVFNRIKLKEVLMEMLEEVEKDQDLNLKIIDDSLYLYNEYSDRIHRIITETVSKGWEIYESEERSDIGEL